MSLPVILPPCDPVCRRSVLLERLENYPAALVAAGDQFSLAVTRWGGLFAWGDNRQGQLGTQGRLGGIATLMSWTGVLVFP